MTKERRQDASLQKLTKLAKTAVNERQRHVADLEAARSSAEASLDWLKQSVRAEEEKASQGTPPNFAAMQGFLRGVEEKRFALQATMTTLTGEIDEARTMLREAHTEVQKLEHLLGVREKAARKLAAKKDAALVSDYAMRLAR